MKIGDLVQSIKEDADVGVVVAITHGHPSDRVDVFWGSRPSFGQQFEWDWDYDLKVVEES